jgi:hypothetical protein
MRLPGSKQNSYFIDMRLLTTSSLETPIPRWDAKFYTKTFNPGQEKNYNIYKIPRNFNTTSHVLATQARNQQNLVSEVAISCQNPSHIPSCPIRDALEHVLWDNLSHLTVYCCYFYKAFLL